MLITRNGGFTNFINVDITPSMFDYGISEGLCGVLDNDRTNDKLVRSGSTFTDPNLSWRYDASVAKRFLRLVYFAGKVLLSHSLSVKKKDKQ